MSKKKAIKLAAATAIAASSFAAVAPHNADAAVSVSKTVKDAKAKMYKPFKTYFYAKSYVKVGTVEAQVKDAKKAYDSAKKVIAKYGGKKKNAYLADLKASYKYITRGQSYVDGARAAYYDAQDMKEALEVLNASVEAKKFEDVKSQYEALTKDVANAEKAIKVIYGADAERIVKAKYTASIKSALTSAELKAAYELSKDETAPVLTVSDLAATVDKAEQTLTVSTDDEKATVVVTLNGTEVAKGEKGYALTLVDGDNKIVVTATDEAGNKEEKTIEVKYNAVAKVESVTAVTDQKVTLSFNKAVEGLKVADVVVTEPTSGNKLYVKSVTASEDKKSVNVEFYDTLASGKTYNFDIKVGENTLKAELAFVIGEAATIQFEDQTIANNGSLKYKVLAANGFDITSRTKVEIETDKAGDFTTNTGSVSTVLEDESAFVVLKVKKADGTYVSSSRVKVTAQANAAKAFTSNWTLADETYTTENDINFEADTYKQDTVVNLGSAAEYIHFEAEDQFGEAVDETGLSNIKFESLDTSVLLVDQETGKVTPRKEGKAPVRITLYNNNNEVVTTKTVEISVLAEAKLNSVSVNKNVVNAVSTSGVVETLNVKLLDQFENAIAGNVKIEVADKTVAQVESVDTTQAVSTSGLDLDIQGLKAGSTTITLTAGTFTKTITVNVQAAGATANYRVDGFKSGLLVKDVDTTTDVNETQMTIAVKPVDSNGLITGADKVATFVIKDKNGEEVSSTTDSSKTITASNLAGEEGPFTLEISVGTLKVYSGTFTVSDNRVAPTYQVKASKLSVLHGQSLSDLFDSAILDFGSVAANADITVTDVDFDSNKESVIVDADTRDSQGLETINDGTASIYVDSVTVENGEGEEFVLDLNGLKVDISADVTKTTAQISHDEVNFGTSESPVQKAVTTIVFSEKVSEFSVKSGQDAFKFVVQSNGSLKAFNGETEVEGTTEEALTGYTKFTHPTTGDTVVVKFDNATNTLKAAWGHELSEVPAIFASLELKAKDLAGNESLDLAVSAE